MSKSNKILLAVATLLVSNAGCSQLHAPRSTPMDEAVHKVELTPPAVSEFKKAKANEAVKLADATKTSKVTDPQPPVSLASNVAKPPALPSEKSGPGLPSSTTGLRSGEGKTNGEGEFVIGRKITKSTSAKASDVATTAAAESLTASSKSDSKFDPKADSKFVPPAPPSLETNVASSLPGPAAPPQKGLAALPGALPPAATNLPSAPAAPAESVQLAKADTSPTETRPAETDGKKIPHAVSRGAVTERGSSVLEGFALNEVEPSMDDESANTDLAKADSPKDQPATIDYKPMPMKVGAPAVATTERATEHNDPQVQPVAAVADATQAAAAMPAIGGSLPPAPVVAATPPAAPVSAPVQPPQIIAAMPPAPKGAPPAVAAAPANPPVAAPAVAAPPAASVSQATDGKLELDRFQLCTEIVGFGKTIPRETEMVSRGERLLAYVEVRNFASRSMNGEFETALGCDLSLENSSGQTVYNQTFPDIVDKCAKPRRDFFCHFLFSMPSTVLPGKYKLRIRIVDRNSSATSEAVVDVMVGSKESSVSGLDQRTPTVSSVSLVITEEPARLGFSKGHKAKGIDQS